jgi:hypothetical protein
LLKEGICIVDFVIRIHQRVADGVVIAGFQGSP